MNMKIGKNSWRKLDNTAKIFSVEEGRNNNTYRLSAILKKEIDPDILKEAVIKTLEMYPFYRVRLRSGLFWNYLENNNRDISIEVESLIPCKKINLRKNNGYLFKVTYYNKKINLDIYHVLTDGSGAIIFLKGILYNYLNFKYNIDNVCVDRVRDIGIYRDENLENVNRRIKCTDKKINAYLIKDRVNLFCNKTYHYIVDLNRFKEVCKKRGVSITEYLTALYIYALYRGVYNKKSNRDLVITVPIDLRGRYKVETFSNFFTYMNIEGKVVNNKKVSFSKILTQVKNEFKKKLSSTKIEEYLARDVKLGTNMGIRLVPLPIKKIFMEHFGKMVNHSFTTTLSNIGQIKILDKYKKYIDNVMVLVNAGMQQKAKCTVCSYENKLTVTLNSNLVSKNLEEEFYKLLVKYVGKFRVESNML